MDTKAFARRIVAKYKTRGPFKLANELGFIVIFAPLVGMRGLRQHVKQRDIIYIDSNLSEQQQRLVCSHEL